MNFEVQHALAELDARTPTFYVFENLSEPNPRLKRTTATVLSSLGNEPSAAKRLREVLRLY